MRLPYLHEVANTPTLSPPENGKNYVGGTRYVGNAPINYRDPSGHAIVFDDETKAKEFVDNLSRKYGAKHLAIIKGRSGAFYVTGDVRDSDAFFKYADDLFPNAFPKLGFDSSEELTKLAKRRQNLLLAGGVAGPIDIDYMSKPDGTDGVFGPMDGSLLLKDKDLRLKVDGAGGPVVVDIGGEGGNAGAINVNIVGTASGKRLPRLMPRIGAAGDLPIPDQSASKVIVESVPLIGASLKKTASEINRIIKPGGEIRLFGPNNEVVQRIHDTIANALGDRLQKKTPTVSKDDNLTTIINVK